jgi:hypothetical protein
MLPQYKQRISEMSKSANAIIPVERIASSIYVIRGHRVMLSPDLAVLYGVQPRVLVQAVKRNSARFPADFMFQLTRREFNHLKSQIVTLDRSPRATPYAFTEHGVAMLSAVLRSQRAVDVSLLIIRAFVRLRQLLATNSDLARRLDDLERRSIEHGDKIEAIFDAIRALMAEPDDDSKRPPIGYQSERGQKRR